MAEVPAVIRAKAPPYPSQPICVVTGLPAKYRDPKSGHPYATKEAFAIIRERIRKRGSISRNDSLEAVQRKRTTVERERSMPGSRAGSVKIKFKLPARPNNTREVAQDPVVENRAATTPVAAAAPLPPPPRARTPPRPLPRPMVEANEADFMLEDLEVSLPSNLASPSRLQAWVQEAREVLRSFNWSMC